MSEYTQADFLPKVRQDSAGNVWLDEPAKKRVTLLSDAKSVAQVIPILLDAHIAQVRVEAQEAFFNNPNVQKVGRSIDARLAAAEKLSQVADSLIADAEKAVNPRARLLYYDRLKEALAEWKRAAK